MTEPSDDTTLIRQIVRILHEYKYGKTAMQAGMTMRRNEGIAEADMILKLIASESTVEPSDEGWIEK